MKFKRFIKMINEIISFHSNVDLKTLKIVVEKFYNCLSDKEREKYAMDYHLIMNNHSFQKTLMQTMKDNKIKQCENELNLLKKSINTI